MAYEWGLTTNHLQVLGWSSHLVPSKDWAFHCQLFHVGSQEVTDFLRRPAVSWIRRLLQGGDKEISQFEGGCHFALPDATEQNLETTLSFWVHCLCNKDLFFIFSDWNFVQGKHAKKMTEVEDRRRPLKMLYSQKATEMPFFQAPLGRSARYSWYTS